ncbi:glycoside hydrolase family 65 protein [Saccharopolyspora rhizosphaerae]|uniref:Glycoside hydrolase family 65 protein n=1 Tax=Saccharopolyspora rhizosphaerae TaxID=2492662 RepID=A0A426JLK2_9PSEU|nr:glycosyl hydrolase family 65 protein [Saccharopolyspora rhizosphaerae]RRO14103.1 glycoside hydrolase family 65 protein [Saccharopolyspora rhizosphaerae]
MTAGRLRFEGYDPDDEGRREALCTLGNGYFATRGAAPESVADDVHYPGTYLAGCFNRLTTDVAGHRLEDESIVNAPNWLPLTFRIDQGPWFALDHVEIFDAEQELDLQRGILVRRLRFRDQHQRTTRLVQHRLVHLAHPHLAGLHTSLQPEDWSGAITVRSGLDGAVANTGVARYRDLAAHHLVDHHVTEASPDLAVLDVLTSQSRVRIAVAQRNRLLIDGTPHQAPTTDLGDKRVDHEFTCEITPDAQVQVEKIVSLHTSRDAASTEPVSEAVDSARDAPEFDELCRTQAVAWARLHRYFSTATSLSEPARRTLALHRFHLLQTVSPNSTDLDVGLPARGLHGEAYCGHVFWDELFVLPVLDLRLPQLSRALLRYRYRRLPRARGAARHAGLDGAMFPWQSGSNGREESQSWHLNPRSGRWLPDHTHLQRHVGLAIAHSARHHHLATGDDDYLNDEGAELICEITRFFSSLATYDRSIDRYVIRGVVGPDEYHTAYPGNDAPGIDNNAYTNVMTAWLCATATQLLRELPDQRRRELTDQIDLRHNEIDRWDRLAHRMFVPFHDRGVLSQFEGYHQLTELDWDAYRRRYGDIQRLDRILEAEGDDPNRYQVSKQADVLMLFYLLSAEELDEVLGRLGYPMVDIPANVEHYLARTSHGSTLSAVVHAWVLARGNRRRALEFFEDALVSDLHDTQHGTTAEGIHLAAMTGTLDLVQRCFTGIEIRPDGLHLNPQWPTELGPLELTVRYHGQPLTIRVSGRAVAVRTAPEPPAPTVTCVCGPHRAHLRPGETARFSMDATPATDSAGEPL